MEDDWILIENQLPQEGELVVIFTPDYDVKEFIAWRRQFSDFYDWVIEGEDKVIRGYKVTKWKKKNLQSSF
jgi:hypothetical protein